MSCQMWQVQNLVKVDFESFFPLRSFLFVVFIFCDAFEHDSAQACSSDSQILFDANKSKGRKMRWF